MSPCRIPVRRTIGDGIRLRAGLAAAEADVGYRPGVGGWAGTKVPVGVRNSGAAVKTIRANAIFNNAPITDPKVYQNFFTTLERSMFLGRN